MFIQSGLRGLEAKRMSSHRNHIAKDRLVVTLITSMGKSNINSKHSKVSEIKQRLNEI